MITGAGGADSIAIAPEGSSVTVEGLSAAVALSTTEGALDTLRVNALGGADTVSAQTLPAGLLRLVLDGGADNDALTGSQGDDQFIGGTGADHFSGGPGTDTVTDFNPGEGDTQDTIP